MADCDWDDNIQTTGSDNFSNSYNNEDVGQGRSFGKGRGFVPQRFSGNDDSSSWDNNRSDFGGRGDRRGRGGGRGGRGGDRGRGGRGGFRNNDDRKDNFGDDDGWGNSNQEFGSNRRFDDDGRRGRGGNRGRGGTRNFDDDSRGGGQKDDDDFNGEEPEKKPEPVTYVPKELTEEELFQDTGIKKGINFDDYENIQVNITGDNKPPPINSFRDAQFRDIILENLKRCRYDKPTPIQKYAIPIMMNGRDLMATAQTGSGKTAAFLLPIIHNLLSERDNSDNGGSSCSPNALILSPTRELASQIETNARIYASKSYLKIEIVYGGVSVRHQSSKISRGCHILIATPGRLMDFVQRGYIKFDAIKFLVLDEADRMLDMGFKEEIEKIVNHETMVPKNQRQTAMFSATFSQDIQRLAGKFLSDYLFLAVGIVGGACKDVEQNFMAVDSREKRTQLMSLLDEQSNLDGTLLFVEQKRIADFLASFLSDKGLKTTSIHGDRQQFQREEALRDFKTNRMSILVATNVAARGLDISGVKHVINYDLPKDIDEYVHRIGRTGRLGNKGKATSFYDKSKDQELASNLVRILKQAGQKVPSFLEEDAIGTGDYESSGFGAYDYRKSDDGFKTDSRNQPQAIADEEDWG